MVLAVCALRGVPPEDISEAVQVTLGLGAGLMLVLWVAAAFAGTIVVRYQMTASGSLAEDAAQNKVTRWQLHDSWTPAGIIGHIRECSDPDSGQPNNCHDR